jgi:hypothetical protein
MIMVTSAWTETGQKCGAKGFLNYITLLIRNGMEIIGGGF